MTTILAADTSVAKTPQDLKERVYILGFCALSYSLDSVWLFLLALQGNIALNIAVSYFVLGWLSIAGFGLIYLSKTNLLIKDSLLILPQILIGFALALVFLYLAPQAALFFLISLFAFSAYSVFKFSVKTYRLILVLTSVVLGWVIFQRADELGFSLSSGLEPFYLWGSFVSALARIGLFGQVTNQLRNKLHEKNLQLEASLRRIDQLASTDELTQTLNRHSFIALAEYELQRSHRSQKEFSILLMDLDHFKTINEHLGHTMADEVLKMFSQLVKETIRVTDSLGRYGGEEFILLLPETGATGGIILAERIRQKVANFDWSPHAKDIVLTVSVGVATCSPSEDLNDLIVRAGSALDKAKRLGRNQCVKAEYPGEPLATRSSFDRQALELTGY